MKTRNALTFIAFSIILFSSCKDDEMSNEEAPMNIYESCCEMPGVDITIGQGNIFIPNIFTPNEDGINDVFIIWADENIAQVEELTIKDKAGTDIFTQFSFMPNEFNFGWLPSETEAPNGLYDYDASIRSLDGVVESVSGSVCVYRCKTETDSILVENIPNCQFSTQHDGEGGHDHLAPSLESAECF